MRNISLKFLFFIGFHTKSLLNSQMGFGIAHENYIWNIDLYIYLDYFS